MRWLWRRRAVEDTPTDELEVDDPQPDEEPDAPVVGVTAVFRAAGLQVGGCGHSINPAEPLAEVVVAGSTTCWCKRCIDVASADGRISDLRFTTTALAPASGVAHG